MIVEVVALLLRGTLAVVLISAGAQKVVRKGSPSVWSIPRTAWIALGAVEVLVGLALLTPTGWLIAAPIASVLFAGFAIAVAGLVRRGVKGDCGCGGLLPLPKVGYPHVGLNGLLAVAATLVAAAAIFDQTNLRPAAFGLYLAVPALAMLVARTVQALAQVRQLSRNLY